MPETAPVYRYSFWLTFAKPDARLLNKPKAPRSTKGAPDLDSHERSMKLTVDLPRALFERLALSANIVVDQSTAVAPEIDVAAAEEALASVLGCAVRVAVERPNE